MIWVVQAIKNFSETTFSKRVGRGGGGGLKQFSKVCAKVSRLLKCLDQASLTRKMASIAFMQYLSKIGVNLKYGNSGYIFSRKHSSPQKKHHPLQSVRRDKEAKNTPRCFSGSVSQFAKGYWRFLHSFEYHKNLNSLRESFVRGMKR